MGIGISRLANLSWLMISDRQIFAIRSLLQPKAADPIDAGNPRDENMRRVPTLNWPPNLFKDGNSDG